VDGVFEEVIEESQDNSVVYGEDAAIPDNGTSGKAQAVTTGNGDLLTCDRCGNREQNLAAARYHYRKLCPLRTERGA
jgi:hypothetical protein